MIRLLFVDTETTGICNMRLPYNEETLKSGWPYLTQVAWAIVEFTDDLTSHEVVKRVSYFIKPRFESSALDPQVVELTGITYSCLESEGVTSAEVLTEFFDDLGKVQAAVAHNATFDMKMLKAEVLRLGWDNHMRIVPWIDTCYHAMRLCNLRQPNGRMKFPTLTEFYQRVTGHVQDSVHTSDADVETLIVAFQGLCTISCVDRLGNIGPIMDAHHFQAIQDKFKLSQKDMAVS